MADSQGLEPDEDEALRRLVALSGHGSLTAEVRDRVAEMRSRDRRRRVREPGEPGVPPQLGSL